jgi:ribonuclease HI
LYLSDSHYFKFKLELVRSTNNKVELMALKLIFMIVVENGVQKIQIMGNFMVVINWMRGIFVTNEIP